jgi:hypothetical protein
MVIALAPTFRKWGDGRERGYFGKSDKNDIFPLAMYPIKTILKV